MALLPIRTYGDPVLRKKSEPITEITPELRQLARDMLETLYDSTGCGLAAPQIGKNIRLVVIDTAIPDEEEPRPYIMFNPEWETEADAEMVDYDEGCLSIPDLFCNVVRPNKVAVRFFDIQATEDGEGNPGKAQEEQAIAGTANLDGNTPNKLTQRDTPFDTGPCPRRHGRRL